METPAQSINRLLNALEALAREDQFLLKNHHCEAAADLRQRELSIVARLAELMKLPATIESLTPAVRSRAQHVLALLQSTLDNIASAKSQLRAQLDELQIVEHQTKRLRPAYGRAQVSSAFSEEA